jgi:DNA-binding MarR family transcriptional regulator
MPSMPNRSRRAAPSDDVTGEVLLDALRATTHALTIAAKPTRGSDSYGRAAVAALRLLVRANEPVALADVARHLGCCKSNVTQLSARLAAYGFARVVDVPSGGGFRGGRNLVITDLGREAASGSSAREARAVERVVSVLAARERRLLLRMLERLKHSAAEAKSHVVRSNHRGANTSVWLDPYVTREVREFMDDVQVEKPLPEPVPGFSETHKEFMARWMAWHEALPGGEATS